MCTPPRLTISRAPLRLDTTTALSIADSNPTTSHRGLQTPLPAIKQLAFSSRVDADLSVPHAGLHGPEFGLGQGGHEDNGAFHPHLPLTPVSGTGHVDLNPPSGTSDRDQPTPPCPHQTASTQLFSKESKRHQPSSVC